MLTTCWCTGYRQLPEPLAGALVNPDNAHLGMPWHMYNWDMRTHATYQVRAYTTPMGYARLERVMRMCAIAL